jgi:hypothetical protein
MPGRPIAIQAMWDGDTDGWIAYLEVVLESGLTRDLAELREGDSAKIANDLGTEVAARLGVPFWFPSMTPDLDCPGWLDRNGDRACVDCKATLVLRSCHELPNDICDACRAKRKTRQQLRDDVPVDASGVTVVLTSDDGTYCGFTAPAANDPVARFALEALGRAEQLSVTDEVLVEGADLVALEAELVSSARLDLAAFDKLPVHRTFDHFKRHVFEGRTLLLERGFHWAEWRLHNTLTELERCREAIRDGLTYRLWFRNRLSARMYHVLIFVRLGQGATITAIGEGCREWLDEAEVRDAVDRLVATGHVTVDDNVVRVTTKGRYA